MAQGRRVVITGLGTVCPNGNNVTSSWNSVINGESGAELIQRFDTSEFATKFGATVKDFDKNENIDPKDSRRLDPFIQFGLAATAEAIKDSGINLEEHDLDRIGVSIGSGIGGLETIEKNSLIPKPEKDRGSRERIISNKNIILDSINEIGISNCKHMKKNRKHK